MYARTESEYHRAKMKAARKVGRGWVKPSDLPSNAEVRDEIQRLAWMFEGGDRLADLRKMRLVAVRIMRMLERFRPHLIGSTLTGYVRRGSDIDIHLFTTSLEAITSTLDLEGIAHTVERKRVRKNHVEQVFTHIHLRDHFEVELTCYDIGLVNFPFKSSITGKTIERASLTELQQLLLRESPELDLEAALLDLEERADRFDVYRMLLLPLARVQQSRKHHPEGDVLYHSLQVFQLGLEESPWDEEFLLAALLHDVGKGIDPDDHVAAGLEALGESITPRTAWLIARHMEAHRVADGSIGARAKRRLQEHEDFDTLMLLEQCDRGGRVRGIATPDVDDALATLKELSNLCG